MHGTKAQCISNIILLKDLKSVKHSSSDFLPHRYLVDKASNCQIETHLGLHDESSILRQLVSFFALITFNAILCFLLTRH